MELFGFPCSNSNAFSHYCDTVEKEIKIDEISTVVDASTLNAIKDKTGNTFRLWGVIPGENNKQNWNLLAEDDLVIFYREKRIIASCKVKYKIENETIAKHFWGENNDGDTWSLLVFLDSFEERDISSLKPNGSLYKFQGFQKVADKDNKAHFLNLLSIPVSPNTPVHTIVGTEPETALEEIIDKALSRNKQIILTGAPGTGKTYSARQYVEKRVNNENQKRFVQFHPSYDYSDFVEGLRPIILNGSSNDDPTFVRLDGTFKSFCRFIVEENFKELIKKGVGSVSFETFKEKYLAAEEKKKFKTNYYFVIDEINRADLSKVFGELMYGLEESYRGMANPNPIKTQYKNLSTYKIDENGKGVLLDFDVFKDGFFVPTNLYIIGTMNNIDKSVDAFDFALRRRFNWVDIRVSTILKPALKEMYPTASQQVIDELARRINAMNEVISNDEWRFGLTDAYHVGHAYFKSIDIGDLSSLNNVFAMNIVPLIKEYTRGRDSSLVNEFINKCAEALEVSY